MDFVEGKQAGSKSVYCVILRLIFSGTRIIYANKTNALCIETNLEQCLIGVNACF